MEPTTPKKRGRPVKLKEFIKDEISKGVTDFDIKLNENAEVDSQGLSSVKFSIEIKNNIFFTFTMNGVTTKTTVNNVLQSLKELSKSIVPSTVKTVSVFHYELNNLTYHRILRVQQMKMLLSNINRQLMVSKVINTTLGLSGEDLYK